MTAKRRITPFLTPRLRALDVDVKRAVPRVVKGGDAEAIHDLRVAMRRLRTMLKLARPVYGKFHVDAVRAAYTEVFRSTGDLRDEEVLDEILDEIAVDEPTFVAWRAIRAARERSLRRVAVERVRGGGLGKAADLLRALTLLPVEPGNDKNLAKFARRAVERAQRGVHARADAATDDASALHELRIAYKELRYAAELLGPALPPEAGTMAEVAARFQKRLGEIHDVDVANETVARSRTLSPATRNTLLERLAKMREKRVGKYLGELLPRETLEEPVSNGTESDSATPSTH